MLMQPTALLGHVLGAAAARVDAGRDETLGMAWQRSVLASGRAAYSAQPQALGADWWILVLASLMALLAVGGVAGWVARHFVRRSTPELLVLLDRSAAFYGRWPEDRLERAPRSELVVEAARCRRIIELLERRTPLGDVDMPAEEGPMIGLRAWIALLSARIDGRLDVPSGSAYA
jgi:hypothetical protein